MFSSPCSCPSAIGRNAAVARAIVAEEGKRRPSDETTWPLPPRRPAERKAMSGKGVCLLFSPSFQTRIRLARRGCSRAVGSSASQCRKRSDEAANGDGVSGERRLSADRAIECLFLSATDGVPFSSAFGHSKTAAGGRCGGRDSEGKNRCRR